MNNLKLPQVAPNQNQKETTINDQVIALDAAITELLSMDFAEGDVSLTESEFTRSAVYVCENAPATQTLTIPDDIRRPFTVKNDAGHSITVKAGVSGSTVAVADGSTATLYADGEGDLWSMIPASIADAPDSDPHVRVNGAWVKLVAGPGITLDTSTPGQISISLPDMSGHAGDVLTVGVGETDADWVTP